MSDEPSMDDDFLGDFVEPEPEPEHESEPEPEPETDLKMPVIIPIDEKPAPRYMRTYQRPRKTDKPYKVSEKVIERNRRTAKKNSERRAEDKRKLEEYEKLMQAKSLTRDEADQLLNEKLVALEERITSKVKVSVPKIAPIPEEPQGYTSDSQRRFSSRFKVQPASPIGYDRFRRF